MAVGDLAAAGEAYAEAAEIDRAARHAYGRFAGMVMHARMRAEQGRLREADEAFRRALRLLTEGGFELSPAAGVVHIGMADLRYERDDLDSAERALERGVELAERTGDVSTLVWAYRSSFTGAPALRVTGGGSQEKSGQWLGAHTPPKNPPPVL